MYRRAYNLAIERYLDGTYKDEAGKDINLRPWVKGICKPEQESSGRVYNSLICDNAVREAKTTFKAVLKKNKGKTQQTGLAKLHFKSRKGDVHSFRMCRLPAGLNPANQALGDISLTETIPKEAVDQGFSVTFDKGRWFINVRQNITLQPEKQGQVRCVAIDPGVRTFATGYSDTEAFIAGERFAQTVLYPLMKQVDALISQKQKITNQFAKGTKFNALPQWARDRIVHIDMRILKLKSNKDDAIRDLHYRLADKLTQDYDVIFLPHFRTQTMTKKVARNLRRRTCREMLSLCHYKFKLVLKWLAKKRGKVVVDVNESYTTKTLSHSGVVLENVGGKKQFNVDGMIIDRDLNAARGIFIKSLTQRQLEP